MNCAAPQTRGRPCKTPREIRQNNERNDLVDQDHGAIKRSVRTTMGFKSSELAA
ncbi:hypothetical protein [Pandoraea sputorum]|uniref:hypothetical protein n=1 Tax=Pandoraea sputorum TaxID=93222 RepID=UPI001255340C|nr:hypothetical protein [Pandoraea sputorum]VVE58967.1 integrase [Pandoraea sputorum]